MWCLAIAALIQALTGCVMPKEVRAVWTASGVRAARIGTLESGEAANMAVEEDDETTSTGVDETQGLKLAKPRLCHLDG